MAKLTAKGRKHVARGNFVFPPSKQNPKGRYPIPDVSHARNALARSSGKPEEAKVKAAVYRKFPALKASEDQRYRLPPHAIRLTEGDDGVNIPNRIQLFRTGKFRKWDPEAGQWQHFEITRDMLSEMVGNFDDGARGIDIALDFAHRSDEEAAAWFKKLILSDDGNELWGEVDWTPDGRAAVGGKQFRYISPDFVFNYTNPDTGKQCGAVLFGAGLTNRPVIKNMAPTVELTEVDEMAVKKTKKQATKKISEMSKEELETLLSETKDDQKKEMIQMRLEEMDEADEDGSDGTDDDQDVGGDNDDASDDDDDSDEEECDEDADDSDAGPVDPKAHQALKKAHVKLQKKVGKMQKQIASALAERVADKKERDFAVLCAEGKAIPAQKAAFMAGDMLKFAKLAEKPKFSAIGAHGDEIDMDTPASDQVLELAEKAWKEKKVGRRAEAVSYVLHENPELAEKCAKEETENRRKLAEV